ncbi:MAG TPA: selenide, water dikinase SelD [Rhodocyclaceae bacterium]|uniref:selenide, water dikinase SelD n=1 Tax=Zoogloea sp. TaxID=49181 RepID=UPI002B9BDC88|nr:selenide, water dikinase SelD [Zoogloea sp.]HMV63929.1 selenide, water dikinase SelD [Rhodocyclaceae bacterium]HMY48695.1 selenide, water dikinase SelD [Rhodocyclaceae bacterium]HNA67640.1 selenide, water dikinase SelD [Rhodocyclaceae bacterium]HND23265.1 selenide, water dikinase SelD [Rhodocyclaceae bacterium]HNH15513.1 selenide, water dikinase SelD [Zoogloea sp.]
MTDTPLRLTGLSHGGGCGCKIAPGVLTEMLARMPAAQPFANLLVGTETADDAAVWRLNDTQALIATTDFFMPIVDDPFDFGRIAATNALSDVYAMGGTPILALAIVGMPLDKLPLDAIGRILAGGASVCADAGIPVAGGHSIDAPEPIYGLVALGLAHPDVIKRNRDARAGDVLVLGKPLGVGILGSAMKKGLLDADGYAQMIATTTRLNTPGPVLAQLPGVHALTDVTGFGLLGHLLELCRGASLGATVEAARLPVMPAAVPLAQQGIGPGAIARNLASFGDAARFDEDVADWQRHLVADAQTSGGLLVSCAAEAVPAVLEVFRQHGFAEAAVIGAMHDGAAEVRVRR